MSPRISERAFEETIECALLMGGPDACADFASVARETAPAYGEGAPGGYRRRAPEDYDRALCLLPRDALDFVYATQPKEWERLKQHHGAEVKERFLQRLAHEIEKRGALDVLRNGVRDSGCKFELAYFRPASGLNEALRRLYEANVFSVVRQVRYSLKNENSLDLVLFLNGIPIFTAELKNPLTCQTVEHAMEQYCADRDPREPLLVFRRCLAHFAVDPDLVYVTTRLGPRARFLPFNQGRNGGAGNPPLPPTQPGYPTSYLWDRIWARDSVLNLVQHFIHEYEVEDDRGHRTGERALIFPRYHQLDAVRRLVTHAREHGAGPNYLVEHSAGSGKSNSIAWLAHQLSVLHDANDRLIFDSVIVVTDRRVLDRQIQRTVRQFQQTPGVVENIELSGLQLKEALEAGKKIIVSTLQKFPAIAGQVGELPGRRFAVIVDEAHSSQSGESARGLKTVLATDDLEKAEKEEQGGEDDIEDRIAAVMRGRGRLPNLSTFAFTATPKPKTLELFGHRRPDGKFEPFSLYSMRQAIEEGFILDVLENYTTYHVYWSLLKKSESDPHFDRGKASYLLRSFVDLHEHAIEKKVEIMLGHFHERVARQIDGRAKAMIVTRSRLHCVRYKLAVDRHLKAQGWPWKALIAFSGEVPDGDAKYTEAGMNGFPEAQTAETFKRPECRLLVVAEKFQTGFDQPLLHTMYVDKKLSGVNAVQTLSRLNRTHPGKSDTLVLDFANEADEILNAFQPYYEKTILAAPTDPNLLYDLQRELLDFHLYTEDDVEAFARLYFAPNASHDRFYAALRTVVERAAGLGTDDAATFRGKLTDYVRRYAFLSQVLTFADASLEKLYVFARLLRRYLPAGRDELPREIQQHIDMESYRVRQTRSGKIALERGQAELEPIGANPAQAPTPPDIEPLSKIIRDLNERFGTDFGPDDRVVIEQLEQKLAANEALAASIRANVPENARLTFDHVVTDELQEMVETNFDFYKRVTDDQAFARFFLDWLFERLRANTEGAAARGAPATQDERAGA